MYMQELGKMPEVGVKLTFLKATLFSNTTNLHVGATSYNV